MATPNIVNVGVITGRSVVGTLTTISASLLSNAASSNQVFKVNTILTSNKSVANSGTVTIALNNAASGGGTPYYIGYTIPVPTGASLVVLGKDNPIYVEENQSITGLASSTSTYDYIISYEIIS